MLNPHLADKVKMSVGTRLIICLALLCLCQCAPREGYLRSDPKSEMIAVRFTYTDPGAATVCISGSFNNWSEQRDCMSRAGGTWTATIFLPPGRHAYLFVVDGHILREDPGSVLSEKNGFGTNNSVLIVE